MNKIKIQLLLILMFSFHYTYGQNSILWKVTDTVNNKTSTILGTYHQFGNSFIDSIPKLKEKLYKSDIAIFEALDDEGETMNRINTREDTDIRKKIGKKTYTKLLSLSKDWTVDLHKLRPIELYWKLRQDYVKRKCNTIKKTDVWGHMDNYLQFLATEKQIPIYGFETYDEQLELINDNYKNPGWNKQKKEIKSILKLLLSVKVDSDKCGLASLYRNFEIPYQFEVDCPDNVIIKQRNAEWMKELPDLIRNKNCFISVGFNHLKWKCGLLEQLKDEGFIVEPIPLKQIE